MELKPEARFRSETYCDKNEENIKKAHAELPGFIFQNSFFLIKIVDCAFEAIRQIGYSSVAAKTCKSLV